MIPIRAACGLSADLLVVDNVLSTIIILFTSIHYLYYCRAIKFVGPFVLMVYTIIATDIRRFLMIYGIFLIGFSQAFYLVFLSCERAENTQHSSTTDQDRFQNVIQNPLEAFIRTFILTIGEFTVLYRNLAMCPAKIMIWIGKKEFPAKIAYKCSFVLILLMIPIRAACGLSADLLVVDNVLSTIIILFTSIHYLYYCRAIKFVGPFVLMVYTIIATDIRRFLMIYGIFLIGFSQAFYLVFLSCERAENTQHSSTTDQDRFQNVIQNPLEAFIRTFILTIGEFTVLYRNLAMQFSLIFELGVSILQFNLLIAMMTRTYETIYRTRKEYKRQWAQVILMLELSLAPKDRLMYLLEYSRPTGTNKKVRSFVVNKFSNENKSSEEVAQAKEEKARKVIEERKVLLKRRLKDMEIREGVRPITGYGRSPRPSTVMKLKDN
ncbi:transporter, cation channel family protein [Cooperia oncophora]